MSVYQRMNEHIGQRIVARRGQLGMTQDALACALGVPRPVLGEWEAGSSRVGPAGLVAVAAALQWTIADLFHGVNPPPRATGRPLLRVVGGTDWAGAGPS